MDYLRKLLGSQLAAIRALHHRPGSEYHEPGASDR